MAPPINVQDWYGDRHTCQIASGALAHRLCLMVVCVNYSWLMSCKVNWLMQHDM